MGNNAATVCAFGFAGIVLDMMVACLEVTGSYGACKEAVNVTAVEDGAVNEWLPQPNFALVCKGPTQPYTVNRLTLTSVCVHEQVWLNLTSS